MFISKFKHQPNYIILDSINKIAVEVVTSFKLLGFIIDNKLTFNEYVESLVKLINKKLFAIKNIFYLSFKTKLKFFKTFILPHFDYWASIFIYFNKTVLEKIERHYNACLFNLLNIDLDSKLADAHDIFLEEFNLTTFFKRLFIRFSIFTYKILNKQMLHDFKNSLITNENKFNLRCQELYKVPFCKSQKFTRRLSIFLPKFVNKVIQNTFLLSFLDFSNLINSSNNNLKTKFRELL